MEACTGKMIRDDEKVIVIVVDDKDSQRGSMGGDHVILRSWKGDPHSTRCTVAHEIANSCKYAHDQTGSPKSRAVGSPHD